jgi:hypothetical protein
MATPASGQTIPTGAKHVMHKHNEADDCLLNIQGGSEEDPSVFQANALVYRSCGANQGSTRFGAINGTDRSVRHQH